MDTLTILGTSLLLLILIGVPIYMVLIGSTIIALVCAGTLPLEIIHEALFEGLNSFALLAIPVFVVAGSLMERGGMGRGDKEQRHEKKRDAQALAESCICGIVLLHNITCLEEQLCGSLLQRKNLLMMLQ